MKIIKKSFVVKWSIFPFSVLVCLGMSRDEVLRKVSQYCTLSDEGKKSFYLDGKGKTIMLENGITILWLYSYPKPGSGLLAHEIYHAKDFVLDKVGIKLTDDCDELGAYMVEYLNNEIVKKL